MFKGLKNKVGKSITQANNRLRVTKNEEPQNATISAGVQPSTPSPSPATSLIDLNSNSPTVSQSLNQSNVNNQSTDQSPAILDLSNYESTEEIPLDRSHVSEDNPEDTAKGVYEQKPNPVSATTSPTHNNNHSAIRHRNDSFSSQVSDSFFFNANSALMPPQHRMQQFLTSDVESVASEVEDHNLIDSLGVGPISGRDRIGSGRSDGGSKSVDSVSKDDLFKVFKKIYAKNQKYSGKYSQLVAAYRELEKEKDKLKEVLTKCQDKAIRRITELKEQTSLKQMAIKDVEVNYTMMLQEKQEVIKVLQMQVSVLKDGLKVNEEGEIVEGGHSDEANSKEQDQDTVLEELNMLKEKNAKLTKLLGNCKTTILDHREEIKKMMLERDQLNNENTEKEDLEKLKKELKERVEELQEELENYKEEKRRWVEGGAGKGDLLEEDLRRLIEEKMDLEERLATLGDENKKLKKKINDLETRVQKALPIIDMASNRGPIEPAAAADASLIDMQTTSSSSSSLPSSSFFGELKTIVPNSSEHADHAPPLRSEGDQVAVERLISENIEIKKNLTKFKNQAKIFKNICQCVFKAVVIDSNNIHLNSPRVNNSNDNSNANGNANANDNANANLNQSRNSSQLSNTSCNPSIINNGENNNTADNETNNYIHIDADVQELYSKLYDDSKHFIEGRTGFINHNELKSSIVSVLKSGLDRSMLKLKGRVVNNGVSEVSVNEMDDVTIDADNKNIEIDKNTCLTPKAENEEGSEEDWITDEDEVEEGKDNVCGSYIDDYENLALQSGGDHYLQRLLLKWKESCDKYEQQQTRRESFMSVPGQQCRGVVQVEQCTPTMPKASRSRLVVVSDQEGNDRLDGNDHCDTDDDKLIKSSLLDKYGSLRAEHENLLESHNCLRAEMETIIRSREETPFVVESDEVKAQQHQHKSGADNEERLVKMSEVNNDLSNKYSTLSEDMAVIQDGLNNALKEKIELEKEVMRQTDETNATQEQNNSLLFESESLKNELSKVNMELNVKYEDYEQLKVEYEQMCEELKNEECEIRKLKAIMAGMELSVEGLSSELDAVKHENSLVKNGKEELEDKLCCEGKKLTEQEDFCNKLKEDFEQLKIENSKIIKEKVISEKRLLDGNIKLNELEVLYDQVINRVEELQKENSEFKGNNDQLRVQMEESGNLNESLSNEIEELKKNNEIISKMEEVNRENDELKEEVTLLKEKNDQLQIRVEVVQDDLQRSIDGKDAEDDELSQLQIKYDNLLEKYREAEEEIKKNSDDGKDMVSVLSELEEFRKDIELLKEVRDAFSEEARVNRESKVEIEKTLKNNELKSIEVSKELDSLNKQLETKNMESLQEVEALKNGHKEKLEFLKKKFGEIKNDKKQILLENGVKISSLVDELEQAKKENDDLIQSNAERIIVLMEEKVNLEGKLAKSEEGIVQLEEDKAKLRESYKALHFEHQGVIEKKSIFELDNTKLVEDLNMLIGELKNEISVLMQAKEDVDKLNNDTNKELNLVKKHENKLIEEVQGLRNELAEKEGVVLKRQQCLEEVELKGKSSEEQARELERQNDLQQEELHRLNERMTNLENDKIQISEKCKTLEEEILRKSEMSFQSLNESAKEYENKLNDLKSDYDEQLSRKDCDLDLKLKEKEEEVERMINELLNGKKEEINRFKQELHEKSSEIENFKTNLNDYKQNIEILKVKISETFQVRDHLKSENDHMKIEIGEINLNSSKTTQEINSKLSDIQSENTTLKHENEELKMSKERLVEEHQKDSEEDGKKYVEMEVMMKEKDDGWIEKMNEFRKKAETKIKQIKKQKDDYVKEHSVKEESIQSEVERLKAALHLRDNDISELSLKYEDVKESLERGNEQLDGKKKDLADLTERLHALQEEYGQIKSDLEEERIKREAIENLESNKEGEVELVKSECKLLKGESFHLNDNIAGLKTDIERLTAENVELKSKWESLNDNNKASEKELKKELKSLSKQFNKLKEEHEELEGEKKKSLQAAENEKLGEIERLKQEYTDEMADRDSENNDRIKKLVKELQMNLSQKEKQYQTNFTKSLESAENESESRLREYEGDLKQVREDLREKEDQVDEVSHQVIALQDQISEMHGRGEWEELSERCRSLEEKLDGEVAEKANMEQMVTETTLKMEEMVAERNKKTEENDDEPHNITNLSEIQSMAQTGSQVSLSSSCSIIPVEFEYLKAILYKYMTGTPDKETLSKVLCRIMKYSELEETSVINFNRR